MIARRGLSLATRQTLRPAQRRFQSGGGGSAGSATGPNDKEGDVLRKGAKRDPELYVRRITYGIYYKDCRGILERQWLGSDLSGA